MPDVETHCAISKERTGEEFRKLHEWIDAPRKELGFNHRIERHAFHEGYKDYIEKEWGKKGVVEWLFHLSLDNIETANKFASDIYITVYDKIEVGFEGKKLKSCKFDKSNRPSIKPKTYEK